MPAGDLPSKDERESDSTESQSAIVGSENSASTLRRAWWAAPYLHLSLSIVLSAGAQLFQKIGAVEKVQAGTIFGVASLASLYTWLGIACHIGSLVGWMYSIKTAPLNIAYTLSGAAQVLVPICAWLVLNEAISGQRWLGILLICIGVAITARQAAQAEEKL